MTNQFGKYQLLKKIASGGMAEIHLAKQRGMEGFEKIVVIKKILPNLAENEEFVQMFLDEARLAAQLSHPNVVQIFDLGRAAGTFFIAMEYIQGENLRTIAKACRKQNRIIPLEHTVKIISQACEGLHHAHTKADIAGRPLEIVHRDVSPQNILVSFDGMTKVVDFGIAKAATQYQETRSGVLKGKYSYMSPEQCTGEVLDARSDIFSLGIVLWELATGSRLFKRPSELMILKEITEGTVQPPREVNRQIPPELEAVILKALEKSPEDRFENALAMHLALEEFLKAQGMTSGTVHVGAFMRELFRDKLGSLKRIEQAQAAGESLESILFDEIEAGQSTSAGGNSASDDVSPHSHASPTSALRVKPKSTTGASRASEASFGPGSMPVFRAPPIRPRRLWILPVALILVVLLAGAGYLWLRALSDSGESDSGVLNPIQNLIEATGSVLVDSTPGGASVRINGREHCLTPCRVDRLSLKTPHRLEVAKAGFRTFAYDFALEGSEPRRIPAPLEPLNVGSVELGADLSEATASLDGVTLQGGPPWRIAEVAAGSHTLRVTAPDRPVWVREIKVEAGQNLRLEAKLGKQNDHRKPPALYSLRSIPAGATFRLDGQKTEDGILSLEPGQTYRLTAQLDGYAEWSDTLRPKPDEKRRLVVRLKPEDRAAPDEAEGKRARVYLDVEPSANVFFDEKAIGISPINGYPVAAGQHTIRLSNAELSAQKAFTVDLKPGEEYRQKIEFNKGKLLVVARPWAHVYIGNKRIGTTPLEPVELFEGNHTIRLENPTFGREEKKSVAIKGGQTTTVEVNFLQ